MGLLGDIYSTIDSKKRQLKGLLADPVETLKLGLLNFKNDQNALLDTQSTAYPWTGAYQQKPTPQQQAAAQKQLADQGANMGMAAATVWHGSPHKFDKFDSSKIGTGEGAQAYGHGLYLAEEPATATTYANMRAAPNMEFHTASGRKLTGLEKALADDMLSNGMVSARAAAKENGPEWMDAFNRIKDETITRGNFYKVDLPDEHIAKMLDWDKPLSQQAPEVQSVLSKVARMDATGEQAWKAAVRESGNPFSPIVEQRGALFDTPEAAAKNLQRLGIPGIRYLDGGSRGAGSGTSNYVVFPGNEDLLTILERNGQGLLGQ